MRLQILFFLLLLILPVFGFSSTSIELAPGKHLIILDSAAASIHIIQDHKEGFFEKINRLEMEIQMKAKFPDNFTRAHQLTAYRKMLQEDLLSFSKSETELLQGIFQEAAGLCENFTEDLFPDSLFLIKTRSNYYGKGTYYTRENSIVIPANEIENPNQRALFQVMMHELFHVFSRYNPDYRKALYELIGFKPLDRLSFPEQVEKILLYNPDGLDYQWAIQLQPSGKTAVPLIVSNQASFKKNQPEFFQYLQFALYEVNSSGFVYANADGSSTLGQRYFPEYFSKIQDNTNYIIHPDEILADNFTYLVLAEKDPESLSEFSSGGQKLLTDMKAVLEK